MHPLLVGLWSTVVETQGERNDVLGDHVSIAFVFQVDFWVALEVFEVGCRKKASRWR